MTISAEGAKPPNPHRTESAADVLLGYVHEHVGKLKLQDPRVREGEPDAVHQMRVACRRLRSTLTTYRSLLDATAVQQLRADLRWLAGVLGSARDIQVIRERLTVQLAAERPEVIVGPIRQRITEQLEADFQEARREGVAALDSVRYVRLVDALDAFMIAPPLVDSAGRPARKIVPGLIREEWHELRTLVRAAEAAPAGSHVRDLALHEVRKRAKRLRYAAESALPVYGEAARRLANSTQELQSILGDHQDSIVARDLLLRMAATAQLRGESSFSYGRLHALEASRAAASETDFRLAWAQFAKHKFRL
ncbi:CHAD domain-containing protein [Leifsonia sp. YAF41]|uniref:CHAD domain-containing protein n=1 Tax=Leifsonia sp. YAF41 TaxID=3233086 RepID=UPI003F992473